MYAVLHRVSIAQVVDTDLVAHLPDPLDTALTLLESRRIPREVQIHEGTKPLEVQPFRGGIGTNEEPNLPVPNMLFYGIALERGKPTFRSEELIISGIILTRTGNTA